MLFKLQVKTYRCSRDKRFYEPSLVISCLQIVHGELLFHDPDLIRESRARQVQNGLSRDPFQNDLVSQRRCDEFKSLRFRILDDDEKVAGAGFGDLAVWRQNPEDLVIASASAVSKGQKTRAVVGSEFCVSKASWPSPSVSIFRGQEAKAGRSGQSSGGKFGREVWPRNHEDKKGCFSGYLDSYLTTVANHSWADVQKSTCSVFWQPS